MSHPHDNLSQRRTEDDLHLSKGREHLNSHQTVKPYISGVHLCPKALTAQICKITDDLRRFLFAALESDCLHWFYLSKKLVYKCLKFGLCKNKLHLQHIAHVELPLLLMRTHKTHVCSFFLFLQPVVKLQNNRGNNKYSYTR